MPSVIQSRRQKQMALAATGSQLAPVEPVFYVGQLQNHQIASQLKIPSEPTEWKAPVVMRGPRTVGMRYLYAHGAVRQPISPLGTGPDIGNAVWSSDFQPDLIGPIHDYGFNDALFQAGYPGFNLGLSFKVQKLQQQTTGPGRNMRMRTPDIVVKIQNIASGKGTVQTTG